MASDARDILGDVGVPHAPKVFSNYSSFYHIDVQIAKKNIVFCAYFLFFYDILPHKFHILRSN